MDMSGRVGCFRFAALLVSFLWGLNVSLRAELPPLIPREVLFGNPERLNPQISPDGKRLAWLAPDANHVMQVWVRTIGEDDEKCLTSEKSRPIRNFFWARNNRQILYPHDAVGGGDENYHLFGIDLESGNVRDFTPIHGVKTGIALTNPRFPNQMLVSLNARDRRLFDAFRLDLVTGALVLDTENPGDVATFFADADFQIRAAEVVPPDGGTEIRVRKDGKSAWRTWLKVGPEETVDFLDFTGDGKSIILRSSLDRDTARVVERAIETGNERELAASPVVDAGSVLIHPKKHVVEAVAFASDRSRWQVVDRAVQDDFEQIARLDPGGDFSVASRDEADTTWLIVFNADRGPNRYFVWRRKAKQGEFLFSHQPKLENLSLAEMRHLVIESRDGLELHSYLTVPVDVEAKGLPMVLFVHGGPWGRDNWGYNAHAQWLANRGYACLQVNFRASTGYGKTFLNAGNKQWGRAMHDDLIDAVNWAIDQGIADPKRVAIMGGSYGGYAALTGVTATPEVFACAIDIVGPSNLRTLIESIPDYWKPVRANFDVRMGNIDDPADAPLIREASPLFKADRIVRPLLIAHGANDPRVKQAESEQIVEAISRNGGQVTFVVYADEGHGFARPENRLDFYARAEQFLASHIGGRVEPIGDSGRVSGSSAVVREVGN
jgi:dipeptidyl aminopeptidase/acylaminoacyl peptidase